MPLVIAVIEFIFLGRQLPSLRSWLALSGESFFSVLSVRDSRIARESDDEAMSRNIQICVFYGSLGAK